MSLSKKKVVGFLTIFQINRRRQKGALPHRPLKHVQKWSNWKNANSPTVFSQHIIIRLNVTVPNRGKKTQLYTQGLCVNSPWYVFSGRTCSSALCVTPNNRRQTSHLSFYMSLYCQIRMHELSETNVWDLQVEWRIYQFFVPWESFKWSNISKQPVEMNAPTQTVLNWKQWNKHGLNDQRAQGGEWQIK